MKTIRDLYKNDVLRARGDQGYLLQLLKDALVVLQGTAIRNDRRATEIADEIEDLVRPFPPTTHIVWSDRAICHFTIIPPAKWPRELTGVDLGTLVKTVRGEDGKLEGVAYPPKDWGGVTCDACRVRLPTLVREINDVDFEAAITAGVRAALDETKEKTT